MNTNLFYISVVVISLILAFLAEKLKVYKNGISKLNTVFYSLLILWLTFVMGFRKIGVGVDDYSYLRIFENISSLSITEYYMQASTEPLYYFLNKIVSLVTNDVQLVFIISSFITVYGILDFLKFYRDEINFTIAVTLFVIMQYFYYIGIIRLGIAVGIISYSLKFILKDDKKKFIIGVFIATLFHYSALVTLIFLFYRGSVFKSIKKIILVVPLGFLFVRFIILPLIGSRYSTYIESSTALLNYSVIITALAAIIMIWLYKKKLIDHSEKVNFLVLMLLTGFIIELFSPLMGIGRTIWYFRISTIMVISRILRVSKFASNKTVILIFSLLLSTIYANYAYFDSDSSHRADYLYPYSNVFFELKE